MTNMRPVQISSGLLTGFLLGYFARGQSREYRSRLPTTKKPKSPNSKVNKKPETPSSTMNQKPKIPSSTIKSSPKTSSKR